MRSIEADNLKRICECPILHDSTSQISTKLLRGRVADLDLDRRPDNW
jgi:hypothetical protein